MQTYVHDSHIFFSDDESNSKDINMNTDTVQMRLENEYSLTDSADVISLNCYVPNMLSQEPKQFLSLDQKSNVLSPQNVPSSDNSFLRLSFITLNHENVQSSSLPSTRQETSSERASLDEDDKSDLQNLQSSLPIKEISHEQTNTKEQSKNTKIAEKQQNQSSALGDFIDQLGPIRVLQSTILKLCHHSYKVKNMQKHLLILLLRSQIILRILLSLS